MPYSKNRKKILKFRIPVTLPKPKNTFSLSKEVIENVFPEESLEQKLVKTPFNGNCVDEEVQLIKIKYYHFLSILMTFSHTQLILSIK